MLKSQNVFVDTQAFRQHKFRFDHPALKRLLELCASGKLRLVLTETVVGEVVAQLKEQLTEANQSLRQFHKLIGPLEGNLPEQYQGLFAKPSDNELIEAGVTLWETYRSDAKSLLIPASDVDSAELLALYFGAKPPFGQSRKKNEFPDAISALSLAAWLAKNKTNIYIVSQDHDLENWCTHTPEAIHIKSLAELIDVYNRAEERLTELTHKLFHKEEARFLDAIKTRFLESGFQYSDNWEADVENIEVQDIQSTGVNLIEVDEDRAVVAVSVQIDFSASISGPDYENGIWDSEDKRYVYVPDFDFEHSFSENYEVSVEFTFSAEAEEADEIQSIEFEDGRDIILSIDDGYHYK
ncbi:MAG TPA: PIN domain-containing protein [Burkholderiaceae bacterium]|nr:PIN domain-containing protein [Burkholderiaceae bacterium]